MTRKRKLSTQDGLKDETCMVLMPYGEANDRYYLNVYVPAVQEAGLIPIRADSLFRPSPILEDVWRLTRNSRVLLADLTGRNPNVFYEVGLAHAIAKPVVLVAASMEDVPFDLRGLRVIVYDKNNESWGTDLRTHITSSLKETLADLQSAIPPTYLKAATISTKEEDPLRLELRKVQEEIRALRFSLVQVSNQEPAQTIEVARPVPVPVPQGLASNLRASDSRLFTPIQDDRILENIAVLLTVGFKIQAIKMIRDVTGLGLKECKDLAYAAEPHVGRFMQPFSITQYYSKNV